MKVKSNRFKCRNLPKSYTINEKIKSKPIMMMVVSGIVGAVLMIDQKLIAIGVVLVAISLYGLFLTKNHTIIGFGDDFVIFYLDDHEEDCYLIYFNDIERFEFVHSTFDVDRLKLELKDHRKLEFKLFERHKVESNFKKHLNMYHEDDEE